MSKVYGAFYYDPLSPKDECYHWANEDSIERAVATLEANAPLPESWTLRPVEGFEGLVEVVGDA